MDDVTQNLGRIGVLMGGVSSEREISLKSGKAITEALQRQGCDVIALDIVDDNTDNILLLLEKADIAVAFIALHGKLGEDGTIQSILERVGIPYTGSGVEASRLAINKVLAQRVFKENGITVSDYVTLSQGDSFKLATVIETLKGFPIVVKPACEGSSIGISLARTMEELQEAIGLAWRYGDEALLERYIEGRELTVGILGTQALAVVEICSKNKFFDFEAKYTKGMTDYVVPAKISEEVTRGLQQAALDAHRVLGCADFSRVDFMLDRNQVYYVLEVNTIPGFTSTSLLPKAAQAFGISFDQLCIQLVEMAYGKKEKNRSATTIRC